MESLMMDVLERIQLTCGAVTKLTQQEKQDIGIGAIGIAIW
jgi:hypothetical protein